MLVSQWEVGYVLDHMWMSVFRCCRKTHGAFWTWQIFVQENIIKQVWLIMKKTASLHSASA